jgi:hypothetical protein
MTVESDGLLSNSQFRLLFAYSIQTMDAAACDALDHAIEDFSLMYTKK